MSAMRKPKVQEHRATFPTEDLVTAAWNLYLEVVAGVAPGKVSETAGQWLGKAAEVDDDTFARAMVLAMDLEAFAPSSLGGSTPFDRLTRRRAMSAEEVAGLAVIRDARMVAFRVTNRRRSGGRDLVPLKAAAVEDGLSKLGLKFKAKESGPRLVEPAAYRAGQVAGRQFQPRSDIEDHS